MCSSVSKRTSYIYILHIVELRLDNVLLNKRVQRALDRSPEKSVEGHSECPLQKTTRWCCKPNIKALGLVDFT